MRTLTSEEIEKQTPEQAATWTKFQKAINDLYESHGVGSEHKQKVAFWNSRDPDVFITHCDHGDEMWLSVMEVSYLSDLFVEDFPRC